MTTEQIETWLDEHGWTFNDGGPAAWEGAENFQWYKDHVGTSFSVQPDGRTIGDIYTTNPYKLAFCTVDEETVLLEAFLSELAKY